MDHWFLRSMWLPFYTSSPLIALHYTNCIAHHLTYIPSSLRVSPFVAQFLVLAAGYETWKELASYQIKLRTSWLKIALNHVYLFHGWALFRGLLSAHQPDTLMSMIKVLRAFATDTESSSPWLLLMENAHDAARLTNHIQTFYPGHAILKLLTFTPGLVVPLAPITHFLSESKKVVRGTRSFYSHPADHKACLSLCWSPFPFVQPQPNVSTEPPERPEMDQSITIHHTDHLPTKLPTTSQGVPLETSATVELPTPSTLTSLCPLPQTGN